ncbi:MAG: FAD-dependent oxidoreductase [Wenzhouxiangella sp.]
MKHAIVIGAGVVGSATALALVERGLEVTLIERNAEAGLETSHANGGGVTPAHSEPWNAPGLLGKLAGNLGRADAPYRLSPLALPGMGTWGLRFLANMRQRRFVENARRNIALGMYSLERLRAWRERHGLEYRQTLSGSMQVYFDERELDESLELRRRLVGDRARIERLDAGAAIEREPALEPVRDRLAGAIGFPDHESGDAAAFTRAVTEAAVRLGARLRFGETVEAIRIGRDGFEAVVTDRGSCRADACVIAAGPESPRVARAAGLRLPIYPVRGYSATFELAEPGAAPTLPMLDTSSRFVTLRLGERRLRVAGLADFAGHRRDIPADRIATLLAGARRLLPRLADELQPERGELWAGLRPVTPDGVALLGPTRVPGVHVNAGHGPMGWTMACGSAEIIADLIADRTPAIDTKPYCIRRS